MSVLVCPGCGDLCDATDPACLGCGSPLHENARITAGYHCAVCILDASDNECPCCGARLRQAVPA